MQFQPITLVWNVFQYFGALQNFSKTFVVIRSKVEKSQNWVGHNLVPPHPSRNEILTIAIK